MPCSQVNTVMESVEMVIHEKDNRIRRLNALYDPDNYKDSSPEKQFEKSARIPHEKTARFGISAENLEEKAITIIGILKLTQSYQPNLINFFQFTRKTTKKSRRAKAHRESVAGKCFS